MRRAAVSCLSLVLLIGTAAPAFAAAPARGATRRPASKAAAKKEAAVEGAVERAAAKGAVEKSAPKEEVTSVAPRGPTRIDFDDRLIQGQTNKSGAVYLFDRKELSVRSMVQQRTSFRDQIVRDILAE